MDPKGFYAPFGPTTAEQRHPGFAVAYAGHECQWKGPSWPYSTAVTLVGLANLLNGPEQNVVSRGDYVTVLRNYALSHRLKRQDGKVVPWIDENLNPFTGDWIARTLLIQRGKQIPERGKDYNHSTFCDLVISGLVGLRARADDTLEVNPLAPESWDYFCLDQVRYRERWLTILWDKTGARYGQGKGCAFSLAESRLRPRIHSNECRPSLRRNPRSRHAQISIGYFHEMFCCGGSYRAFSGSACTRVDSSGWRPAKACDLGNDEGSQQGGSGPL